jgi:potassium-transporting ATPase KdpC subunit
MKRNILSSLILTVILVFVLGIFYPMMIRGIAYFSKGSGNGVETRSNGKVVGFELIGQSFTADRYFQGRPSGVNYNAAGSGGTNKSIFNPEYIRVLQARLDTFLKHNPGIEKKDVPVELITASGSGLDPDLSPAAAYVQVARIARMRRISRGRIETLIRGMTIKPVFGFLGPERVNVLNLNLELDKLR